jgi:hypothetical protein
MDKLNKEKIVRRYCPYKFQHFCDGKPNLSVYDNKEEAVPRMPCRLRGNCPVRYQIKKSEEESDD